MTNASLIQFCLDDDKMIQRKHVAGTRCPTLFERKHGFFNKHRQIIDMAGRTPGDRK